MISSPTEKGVVVIGGIKITEDMKYEDSNAVIELSGDSIDSLKWTILKQKLQYPRFCHVAFPIPNELAVDLYSKQKFWQTSTTGTVVPYKHAHTHLDFEYFQNINEDKTLFFSSSQYQRFFFFLSVSKVFLLPLSNKGFLNFAKKLQFGDFWRNLVVWWRKRTIWWLSGSILVHQYWGKASVLREKNLWRSP